MDRRVNAPWDRAIDRADQLGGAIGHDQLRAEGLSRSAIGRRLGRQLFVRHEGVYALGRRELTPYGEAWAAALAVGGRGGLALGSAAAILGAAPWPSTPHVLVVGGPLELDGVTVRRTRTLHPDEIVESRSGLRHTVWHRTITDLAARSSVSELQSVLDALDRREALDLLMLEEAIRRARGRAGLRKLHRALVPFTSIPHAEYHSLLERFSAVVLHGAGLGDHEIQGAVALPDGRTIHVDVLFRRAGVAVEIDGRSSHDRAVQWGIDKERDRELQKLGFVVLRFTWHDVRDRPEVVIRDLRAVLARRP